MVKVHICKVKTCQWIGQMLKWFVLNVKSILRSSGDGLDLQGLAETRIYMIGALSWVAGASFTEAPLKHQRSDLTKRGLYWAENYKGLASNVSLPCTGSSSYLFEKTALQICEPYYCCVHSLSGVGSAKWFEVFNSQCAVEVTKWEKEKSTICH